MKEKLQNDDGDIKSFNDFQDLSLSIGMLSMKSHSIMICDRTMMDTTYLYGSFRHVSYLISSLKYLSIQQIQ